MSGPFACPECLGVARFEVGYDADGFPAYEPCFSCKGGGLSLCDPCFTSRRFVVATTDQGSYLCDACADQVVLDGARDDLAVLSEYAMVVHASRAPTLAPPAEAC